MAIRGFDTAAAVSKLKEADCEEHLAEAIVGVIAESQDSLATKSDLRELELSLKNDLNKLELTLKDDSMKLAAQMSKLETDVVKEIAASRNWMIGIALASVAVVLAVLRFLGLG